MKIKYLFPPQKSSNRPDDLWTPGGDQNLIKAQRREHLSKDNALRENRSSSSIGR